MALKLAQKNRGMGVRRFCYLILILPFLAGCSVLDEFGGSERRVALAPAPPPFDPSALPVETENVGSAMRAEPIDLAAMQAARGGANAIQQESYSSDCKITDRFDTASALAWRFDERRSLGLNVNGGVGSFGGMKIGFTYKFGGPKAASSAKKCKYDSHLQGLIGTAYNEMFVRRRETIWNQLDDMGLAVWRR